MTSSSSHRTGKTKNSRTRFRSQVLDYAYGTVACVLTTSGGTVKVSTGLRAPDVAFATLLASTAGSKTTASQSVHFSKCSGSYAMFRIMKHGKGTWACASYTGLNWIALDAF